jgi:uncharacterized NAD-dependent epimerase/dehydratase family protein
MDIKKVKLSHKNKVSDGIERFSNISIMGYGYVENKHNDNYNKNSNNCSNYDYDTFIWTKEILEPLEVKIWINTIKNEMENGKNIYNMARLYRIDDYAELRQYAEKNDIEFFDCSNPNRFDELKEYAEMGLNGINSKIITIMGTGRQSGKFTTSMILKEKLEKYFKIGTVGTEPQSKLCGIDEMVIPQPIPSCHVSPAIFGAVKKVDLKNNDLIIVSGQTGIFSNPLEVGTGRGGGIISLSILLGSKPDYVILASNTVDIEYIKKNINAIELLSDSKVIGITINDKNLNLNKNNTEDLLNNISSKLNIPVANVITGTNLDEFIEYVRYKLK